MASKEPSTHSWHTVRPQNVQQPTLRVCLKNVNTSPSALVYYSKQNFPPNFDRSQTCAVSYSRRPVRLKCLLPQVSPTQQKYIPPFFGHPNTIPKQVPPNLHLESIKGFAHVWMVQILQPFNLWVKPNRRVQLSKPAGIGLVGALDFIHIGLTVSSWMIDKDLNHPKFFNPYDPSF